MPIELFKREETIQQKVHELRSFIRACRGQMVKLDRAMMLMASAEHDAQVAIPHMEWNEVAAPDVVEHIVNRDAYSFAYDLMRSQWCCYSHAVLDAIAELKRRCRTCERCVDKAVARQEEDLKGFTKKPVVRVIETEYGFYEPRCVYCSTPDKPGHSYNDGMTVSRLVTYEFPDRESQPYGQLTGILNPALKRTVA